MKDALMLKSRYVSRETMDQRVDSWLASIDQRGRRRALPPLDKSALLLVDLQRYFSEDSSHAHLPAFDAIVPTVVALQAAFRQAKRPIIRTVHLDPQDVETPMQRFWRGAIREGTKGAECVPELGELDGDLLLRKSAYSAFHQTELQAWLRRRGCDTLVIAGVMTHLCCESTARHGFDLGFIPVVVADGCASITEELHLGALRALGHGFATISGHRDILSSLTPSRVEAEAPVEEQRISSPALDSKQSAELAIVGGGPAGIAAALQAHRLGIDLVLIEKADVGGNLPICERVENYPGFPGGVSGDVLMRSFSTQLALLAIRQRQANADSVEATHDGFRIQLTGMHGGTLKAKTVILATGAIARQSDLPGGDRLRASIQELPTVKNQRLLLLGGGEAALDQALLAARLGATQITVAARSAFSAMDVLRRRCEAAGVRLLADTELAAVEGPSSMGTAYPEGGRIGADRQSGHPPALASLRSPRGIQTLEVDAIVPYFGKVPCLPSIKPHLETTSSGSPRTDNLGRSSIPGLYVVGDVGRGRFRQIGIAVGDGLAAGMDAARYLEGQCSLSQWRTQ